MSDTKESFNPFDPTGMFKEMQDKNMAAWAKMMGRSCPNRRLR